MDSCSVIWCSRQKRSTFSFSCAAQTGSSYTMARLSSIAIPPVRFRKDYCYFSISRFLFQSRRFHAPLGTTRQICSKNESASQLRRLLREAAFSLLEGLEPNSPSLHLMGETGIFFCQAQSRQFRPAPRPTHQASSLRTSGILRNTSPTPRDKSSTSSARRQFSGMVRCAGQ